MAFSVSAVQWLCYSNDKGEVQRCVAERKLCVPPWPSLTMRGVWPGSESPRSSSPCIGLCTVALGTWDLPAPASVAIIHLYFVPAVVATRAVLQIYPESPEQVEMLTTAATRCGFTGGLVVDYPHSAKARKHYLCLFAGLDAAGQSTEGKVEDSNQSQKLFDLRRSRYKVRHGAVLCCTVLYYVMLRRRQQALRIPA